MYCRKVGSPVGEGPDGAVQDGAEARLIYLPGVEGRAALVRSHLPTTIPDRGVMLRPLSLIRVYFQLDWPNPRSRACFVRLHPRVPFPPPV